MRLAMVFVMVTLVSACSSSPTREEIAKDEANAAEVRAEAAENAMERAQALKERALDEVPDWVLHEMAPDSTGLYAVGMGQSQSLRVSVQKAMLEAEYGLAKGYQQTLSGSERRYTEDNRGDVDRDRYILLIDKLVSAVPIVGYETIKQEIKAVNGEYVAYVLVKLPYAQFNNVLKEQRATSDDVRIQNAFDELERRVNARLSTAPSVELNAKSE